MWMVFSVFDLKLQEYGPLHLARTEAVAARLFGDAAAGSGPQEETILSMHPEDFELRRLGLFDETTGRLVDEQIVCVVTASEALRRRSAPEKEA